MACNKNYNQHEVADCLTLSTVRLIVIDYKKNLLFILVFISGFILFTVYSYTAEKMIYNETCTEIW